MDPNAAAPAPATEEVVETATPETPAPDMHAEMAAIWDKDNAPNPEPPEPEETAESETAEQPAEAETEPDAAVAVPTDVPGPLKAVWADMPEAARDAVVNSHREMSQKLSAAHRHVEGFGPTVQAVQAIAKENPAVANLTPAQLSQELTQLYRVGQEIQRDPAGTLSKLAQQYGVTLEGGQAPAPNEAQQTINDLRNQVAELSQHVQQMSDPNRMREVYDGWSSEQALANEIQTFAAGQEHWSAVEPHLHTAIPMAQAKLGPDAAPTAVLQEAFNLALNTFVPDARAEEKAGDEPAPTNPERVKTAVKAKSVNVAGKPSAAAKPQSPDEAMAAIWDRNMAS